MFAGEDIYDKHDMNSEIVILRNPFGFWLTKKVLHY